MPSDTLPLDLDALPLVARTDMRDVRMVAITAHTEDHVPPETDIDVTIGQSRYRFDGGSLFVRTTAAARYLANSQRLDETHDSEEAPGDAVSAERSEVGRIEVEVLAEFGFEGGEVTAEQREEFLNHNFLFMIFPYVRTALQQTAADLRLPPTVLPFLRRDPLPRSSSDSADSD